MTRAALYSLVLSVSIVSSALAQNAPTATDEAIAESVRRDAYRIDLKRKLAEAQNDEKRGDNATAARLYEECLGLAKKI